MAFIVVAAMLVIVQLMACETKMANTDHSSFNLSSVKLMTIPTGSEVGDIEFNSNGHHVVASLQKGEKVAMFIDGIISQLYDEVRAPVFKTGNSSVAYIAKKDGKECIVVDNKAGVFYDAVTKPKFLSDGRVVYAAKKNDQWFIVIGVTESRPFKAESEPVPFVSPDGKRLAHIEQSPESKKTRLSVCTIDFTEIFHGQEYDLLSIVRGDMSRSKLVYAVARGGKSSVVVFDFTQPGCSEKVSDRYDDIKSYSLSPDGRHLAFLAQKKGSIILVADTKEYPPQKLDMTLDVSSSTIGTTLYGAVKKDKVLTFINGKDAGKRLDTIENVVFSPDGQHYAYSAGAGKKSFVVIDGADGPEYDKTVAPKFSPDSRYVVYRARKNGQRFVVTADLSAKAIKEHSQYEAVWDVYFSPDGTSVGYGVKIGQELWWKVEKL